MSIDHDFLRTSAPINLDGEGDNDVDVRHELRALRNEQVRLRREMEGLNTEMTALRGRIGGR